MGVNSRLTQSLREYLQHYHSEDKDKDKDKEDEVGEGGEGEERRGPDPMKMLRVFTASATPMKPNGELCSVKSAWQALLLSKITDIFMTIEI